MRRVWALFISLAWVLIMPAPAWAPCHVITFEGEPYSVGEGAGKVTISVSNNGGANTTNQTVDYQTVDGTAKAAGDYGAKSGTVTFTPGGSDVQSFDVPITNDAADEASEQFTVQLSNVDPPTSCVPPPGISEMTATITITDNDPAPQPTQTTPEPKSSTPPATPTKTTPATQTPSPTPTPTQTSPSPTPIDTSRPVAAPDEDDGGLSGGAVGGIVAGAVVLAGAAAFAIRRRVRPAP